MELLKLDILNMGAFKEHTFEFKHINYIQGRKGTGKTMLLAIIYSMFQSNEELYYCPVNGNISEINLTIREKNQIIDIRKQFNSIGSYIISNSFRQIEGLATLNRDLVLLCYGDLIEDYSLINEENIISAISFLKSLGFTDFSILKDFIDAPTKFHYLSKGEQSYIFLLCLFAKLPPGSILLCDSPFSYLEDSIIRKLCDIMDRMIETQFIFTTYLNHIFEKQYNTIDLYNIIMHAAHNNIEFEYKKFFFGNIIEQLYRLSPVNLNEIHEKQIVNYRLNFTVQEEENRNIEFKEIKGNNPCESIIANAEIYIVAFLNSWITGFGKIKWGISDERIVTGVKLTSEDKDCIRRKISERVKQVRPYVSQDLVHISFKNILNSNNQIIDDLYIVEIMVESIRVDELFSTSKGDVYIKTESGKAKLDSYDLQLELKRRMVNR